MLEAYRRARRGRLSLFAEMGFVKGWGWGGWEVGGV